MSEEGSYDPNALAAWRGVLQKPGDRRLRTPYRMRGWRARRMLVILAYHRCSSGPEVVALKALQWQIVMIRSWSRRT